MYVKARSVKDIGVFNEALLGKWRWNLFHNSRGVWVDVLLSKYGGLEGFVSEQKSPLESLWWRNLRKVCGVGAKIHGFIEGSIGKWGWKINLDFGRMHGWKGSAWQINFQDYIFYRNKRRKL